MILTRSWTQLNQQYKCEVYSSENEDKVEDELTTNQIVNITFLMKNIDKFIVCGAFTKEEDI